MEILQKHRHLLDTLKPIIYPRRKLTIGIDGVDGAGKSPLARFLSWQLGMPALETDMFFQKGKSYPFLRFDEIGNLIYFRHFLDRPVIIEGIRLLETLEHLKIKQDVLIYVINSGFEGSHRLKEELEAYRTKYNPQGNADYIFECSEEDFR